MKRIDFLATDGVALNGILYESKKETKDIIVAVHGMSSHCMKERDTVISQMANENGIDYFCFNNRGSELVKYITKERNGEQEKLLGGTSYEDVLEGYEDIVGALIKVKELGYENIYLQGHSLGCTKIVYTYHELQEEKEELLNNIKGVILLSLIDIPMAVKVYLREKYQEYVTYAEEREKDGKIHHLMPQDSFIHPISVKTFLRYTRDNQDIDFAGYGRDTTLDKLNQIEVPLFMRWGTEKEMIIQKPEELVDMVQNTIMNQKKDIDIIEGADHGYTGKEEIVAKQIIDFIKD